MIKDLQDAKMGDQKRLAYIMDRIESGRPIYNSDEQYVRQKFGQLRREITRESEDESEQHDASQDSVTSPPSDQNQSVSNEAVNGSHPSKAWYVLPIFLGVLGGLIAYVKLRKRNRSVAYKTLGLGVGITMLFLVPMLTASTFETEPVARYTDKEIKGQAVTIPYESLVNQSEIHAGEIVRYEGTLIQVKKQLFDAYILRVGITHERFTATDIILLNYKPVTDEEKAWLDRAENELRPVMTDGRETITFWGISKGLAEYTTILDQKVTIPEVDVVILERHAQDASSESDVTRVDPEPQEILNTGEPASNRHTVSYDDVPSYADKPTVERAISDATRVWDMTNTDLDFIMVESNADVNIQWARYIPGSTLGLHSALVTDDGTRGRHSITVRLGIDDCHSTYQQFTHKAIQYTVAHEIGHYLGLRHVDDKTHLMYSGDLFDVDSIRMYDDRNLGIPHVERPEISTVAGMRVQAEIDLLKDDLEQVSAQRQSLKNTVDTEALDVNTNTYNDLAQRIQDLEDQLVCVDIT